MKTLSADKVTALEWQGNLAKIYSITMTPDGRIFFVSPTEGVIFQTDLSGQSLSSIGKKGQGPNEFNWPSNIFYDEPYLYVYDGAKEKMFKIEPKTGQFTQTWRLANINDFSIQGNHFRASLLRPESGHIFTLGLIMEKKISLDRFFGGTPCCLSVSGSKKGAVLSVQDGSFWVAHTGDFLLQNYSEDGRLLKNIRTELPGYVAPDNRVRISRFDVKGKSANLAKFDKVSNLYECGNQLILYRYKKLNDSYLDVFNKMGKRLSSQKADKIIPVGVKDNVLYGFLRGDETTMWDVMLIKFEINQ